mmetsp:Transcript_18525/g.33396  ORF Transcript_18525/g.33396 Transcript_18525/m.33396 type:complete len:337 (-) Transcript_18525:418-1428(-)
MESRSGEDTYVLWQCNLDGVWIRLFVAIFVVVVRVLLAVYFLRFERQLGLVQQPSHSGCHGGRRQNDLRRSLNEIQSSLFVLVNFHDLLLVQHGMQHFANIILEALFQHGIHLVNDHVSNRTEVNIPCVAMLHQPSRGCHQNIHGTIGKPLPLLSVPIPSHQQLARYLAYVSHALEHAQYLTGQLSRRCQDECTRTTRLTEARERLHRQSFVVDVKRHELLGAERLDDGQEVRQRFSRAGGSGEGQAAHGRNGRGFGGRRRGRRRGEVQIKVRTGRGTAVALFVIFQGGHPILASRQQFRNCHLLHGSRTLRQSQTLTIVGVSHDGIDQLRQQPQL